MNSISIGTKAEQIAKKYLLKQGLTWVASNFKSYVGEIDLIMRDAQTLVFVEVRQRKTDEFGSALESVTRSKQKKIIKTAALYLQRQKVHNNALIRFDVVTLQGTPPVVTWYDNAFM